MRIALKFPVDTDAGGRKDAKGGRIPPSFVQTVIVERAGAPLFTAQLGPNLARTPTLEFDLEGVTKGGLLKLTWTDQSGQRHEQTFTVDT